jgi:hypothetical protein
VSARDDFLEVCEASRAARHRLVELKAGKNALWLFHAIDYFLMTYSRLEDRISHAQLVDESGLRFRWDFNRAKAELLDGDVLSYVECRGRGKPSIWGYAENLRSKPSDKTFGVNLRGTPEPTDVRYPISKLVQPELQDVGGGSEDVHFESRTTPAEQVTSDFGFTRLEPLRVLPPEAREYLEALHAGGTNGKSAATVEQGNGHGEPEPEDELVEVIRGWRQSYFVPRSKLTCRWCEFESLSPPGRAAHERLKHADQWRPGT